MKSISGTNPQGPMLHDAIIFKDPHVKPFHPLDKKAGVSGIEKPGIEDHHDESIVKNVAAWIAKKWLNFRWFCIRRLATRSEIRSKFCVVNNLQIKVYHPNAEEWERLRSNWGRIGPTPRWGRSRIGVSHPKTVGTATTPTQP